MYTCELKYLLCGSDAPISYKKLRIYIHKKLYKLFISHYSLVVVILLGRLSYGTNQYHMAPFLVCTGLDCVQINPLILKLGCWLYLFF